jgi:hypothetical protein
MDTHLSELMRQCANATPFARLNEVEQAAVFAWLLAGHITLTGKPLERPRAHPNPIAYAADGAPIFKPGTDFSPTETVKAS